MALILQVRTQAQRDLPMSRRLSGRVPMYNQVSLAAWITPLPLGRGG